MIDLLGGDVGLVQLNRQLAVLAVPAGARPARPVERFQLGEVLPAKPLQAFQLALEAQLKVVALLGQRLLSNGSR